jgi:hypothetical protein
MALIMTMISKNVPLCQWQRFVDSGADGAGFHAGGKNPEKIAQIIFSSLSHPDAVSLVAREFEELSQQVRIQLRTLCNNGNASGNVRKGVQRLNELLNGKLLREEKFEQYTNRRMEGASGAFYKRARVNPAVAGAQRKYASR